MNGPYLLMPRLFCLEPKRPWIITKGPVPLDVAVAFGESVVASGGGGSCRVNASGTVSIVVEYRRSDWRRSERERYEGIGEDGSGEAAARNRILGVRLMPSSPLQSPEVTRTHPSRRRRQYCAALDIPSHNDQPYSFGPEDKVLYVHHHHRYYYYYYHCCTIRN